MWYILMGLIAFFLAGSPIAAPQEVNSRVVEIKKETRVFEKIITEVLRQNFENPFAVTAEPQAAFVPGYGVVVSFYLKINRGTIRGFSGDNAQALAGEVKTTEQQLSLVRDTVLRSLAEYGSTLKHLSAEEKVTICAHVEDRNELDLSRNRTALVASSTKADLDNYLMRRIDSAEFRRRVQFLEY